jgi:hypothetical protein
MEVELVQPRINKIKRDKGINGGHEERRGK